MSVDMAKKGGVKGGKKASSKKQKQKLTPAQRKAILRTKQHIRSIKDVFVAFGFKHLSALSGKKFQFKGRECDFDDVYLLDNVLVLVEHTSHGEEHVSAHLVNKKIIFDYINHNAAEFVEYIRGNYSEFSDVADPLYQDHHFQVKIVYASLNNLKASIKDHVPGVYFLDYPYLRYFKNLAATIKASAKWEMLGYLGVNAGEFSKSVLSTSSSSANFNGSVLPESQSHVPAGYKVVSFYVSAGDLIQRAYVLRRDSWRESSNIYQRLLGRKKIESLRRHLLDKKGVAINNIIVTLPESTKVLGLDNKQVETDKIKSVQLSKIELPVDFNSIGIIDGQHRVFSYYEGGANESQMAVLRAQQNLLVTGIIFPEKTGELLRDRFSAGLFLQINTNQSKVKPELIQEIGVILRPFAVQSIARRVLRQLNNRGPFADHFATAFSEGPKVKTATVVSYGIAPLVRPSAVDGLFNVWSSPNKDLLVKGASDPSADEAIVVEFADFCLKEINTFTGAVRSHVAARWTADKSVADRMLTTVIVNGLFHCLRQICGSGTLMSFEEYRDKLAGVENFDFSQYGSNRYNQLGQQLALDFFGIAKA
ncbi:MAG: DGQHR domain-containing protein [Allorhizobium sp.]|uniref:DGQHR domain-containing protein n=1 Tax=Allorhizobium sp. TaxID=633478 RepID=UPI00403414B3